MIELSSRSRELLENSNVDYYEIRTGSKDSVVLDVWNDEVKNITNSQNGGLSVRVLYNGAWGFFFSKDNNLDFAVEQAIKLAKINSENNKKKITINETKAITDNHRVKAKEPIDELSIESIKDRLLEMHRADKDSRIKSNRTVVSATQDTRNFINSFGTNISQSRPYAGFWLESTSNEGDRSEKSLDGMRGVNGLEILENLNQKFESNNQIAIDMLNAKLPKGGYYDCICDFELAGTFVHEAIGHAAEADAVITDQSCLKNKIGEQIGPDFINIVNDATVVNNGFYAYDDEGIPGQKVQLMKDGVLTSYLHNRESASVFDMEPTGNARAEKAIHPPIVRMADTHIQPGKDKFDDMVESIKDGYLLTGMLGGTVDPAKGTFNFVSEHGYKIENGEIKHIIKSSNIGGETLQTLNNISMVSKDKIGLSDGTCGKMGQACPVTGTHPAIKLNKVQIGGKN